MQQRFFIFKLKFCNASPVFYFEIKLLKEKLEHFHSYLADKVKVFFRSRICWESQLKHMERRVGEEGEIESAILFIRYSGNRVSHFVYQVFE